MRIFFINNEGNGFAQSQTIDEGTTIGQFFASRFQGCQPAAYVISVNRQAVSSSQILQEGDRVTITPSKVRGATTL